MPIYAPGHRINPSIQRRSTGRKAVFSALTLTTMVDMFAMLVIFLLNNFSAEGEILVLPPGLQLPAAKNTGSLEKAPSIVVGMDEIQFEGETLARTEDVRNQKEWNVPGLQDKLAAFKQNLEAQDMTEGNVGAQADSARQKINISADKRLEFQVVKKIIYTAGFAGFPDFRFAVFGPATHKEKPKTETPTE